MTILSKSNISKILFISIFAITLSFSTSSCQSADDDFKNPPREVGVRCWWWWLNSNVTMESITKDLEAMHDKGFSGAMIFDAGTELGWGPDNPVPNGPMFSSPEWIKLFVHAIDEAERLDLKLGVSIQSGWNLGGPNVTLDNAAKQITWSEISLKGGKKIQHKLATPKSNHDYYRDICVLAFPDKGNTGRLPIGNLSAKTGAHELGGSAPDCRFLLNDNPSVKGEEDTKYLDIIDISQYMSSNGEINWEAPEGKWTIMRFGYTPTLAHVKTSSDNWKGHVIDYLSKEVFLEYWEEIVDPILKAAGTRAGTVLTHLETDSWECGGMNWSPGFPKDFYDRTGYDIIKYLPVVAGKIVDNRDKSNAFLADLRKTIAASISDNHYRTFAEQAAKYDMGIQPESAGPHAAPIDGITNYSHSDIVMSEFWVPSPHRPNPENRYFVKQAASAAHIYGKQFVGAESFTSLKKPVWSDVLWSDQKPSFDHEVCSGLNIVFFHTFTNSPKEMGIPGQEYFAGTHINPQASWWDYSDGFITYLNRVQQVVQQGKFVADVLYYYGDHVPNIARYKEDDPAGVLPGYDYDITNEEVLLQLKVVNKKIVVPGGIEYKILALPDHEVISLAALKKVKGLLDEGATVLGPKPERMVTLVGGEEAQIEFQMLSDELWGPKPQEKNSRNIGQGQLIWGFTANYLLRNVGIPMDFEIVSFKKLPELDYIHYTIDNSDVYFVCNQSNDTQTVGIKFRVSGKQPEIWDPITGEKREAVTFKQYPSQTSIPLKFDPYGSLFVVFKDSISPDVQGTEKSNWPEMQALMDIEGPWHLAFDTAWGGPGSMIADELFDWSTSSDEGIKYYSGKVVYTNTFDFENFEKSKRYWIELNELKDVGIASIELNGKDLGIVWTKPFRMEITEALKSGENSLIITVVNNWHNRMIGDRGKPQEERFTMTNINIRDDWKLGKSGLLGPVKILSN